MLSAAQDWFLTGQAWGEVAETLSAAGAPPSQVREAWEQSAVAYAKVDADEEAAASRTRAETAEAPEEQLSAGPHPPSEYVSLPEKG